ncbi:PfkB family carbohydrate kinase [Pseudopelagicola sp. nBUS_20]|uniref:PfkB family carbohydrate kinase n=1 Tax=Pseudopelagicola sp. nBUS_20 TaxID=3395317 RepID=UPI003EB6DE57
MSKVLCVGAAVVDFVFHLPNLPSKAEKYGTEHAETVGGGCAANAAVAIARLGGQALLGARLGNDAIGELVVSGVEAEGVDVSNVTRTTGARSSFSSVYIDQNGERQIVNFRGEGLILETKWFVEIPNLDAVLVDTRRFSAAVDALKLARKLGIPGVLDGEAPVDVALLNYASHAAFSMQGLRDLKPDREPETALLELTEEFGCWICVTDGENGVWYLHDRVIRHCPAFTVKSVDTLGAGDIWHGAFALSLAQGKAEKEAIYYANAAAALKCTRIGGRNGAPNRQDMEKFLKENTV